MSGVIPMWGSGGRNPGDTTDHVILICAVTGHVIARRDCIMKMKIKKNRKTKMRWRDSLQKDMKETGIQREV